MPRFEDYTVDPEVKDIVERYVKKFPQIFGGFKVDDIFFIVTQKKRLSGKFPIKVKSVPYPHYVSSGFTYVFETYETKWDKLNQKQKNLSVFHAMCAIPQDGFDPLSTYYGKIAKPDYEIYQFEYAASGGVPNWQEDDSARDPMEIDTDEIQLATDDEEEAIPAPKKSSDGTKSPVTIDDVAEAGMPDEPVEVAS
jgi:hypothetical protein